MIRVLSGLDLFDSFLYQDKNECKIEFGEKEILNQVQDDEV